MAEGIVIVCTSNRAPWELSPAGAHEDLFAHFVGVLTRACPPFELSSERDYRRVAAAAAGQVSTVHSLPIHAHECLNVTGQRCALAADQCACTHVV